MGDGIVIYNGFLKKSPPEHRLMRSWQRRFFVLRSNKKLFYFKSEKDKKPVKDPIDLSTCHCVEAKLQHKNFHYVFSVNTTSRTYYLVAESQDEMDTWVDKLCFVCGFERQEGQSSPDGLRQRLASQSDGSRMMPVTSLTSSPQNHSVPNDYAMSPPGKTCPLSMSQPPSEPESRTERSHSDPDCTETIKRATKQYNDSLQRRRSTLSLKGNMTLPLRPSYNPTGLPKVAEGYDPVQNMSLPLRSKYNPSAKGYDPLPAPVPSLQRNSFYDDVPPPRGVSPDLEKRPFGGSPAKAPLDNYDIVTPHRRSQEWASSPKTEYDIVPIPRPASQNMNYDIVPSPRGAVEDDIYDVPPTSSEIEQETYDIVPQRPSPNPPGSPQQDDIYDIVPRRYESEEDIPKENYDIVPPPRPKKALAQAAELYDIVPAPRPGSDLYSYVPTGRPVSDEIYDIPPTAAEIYQGNYGYNSVTPTRPSGYRPKEMYDQVPPPRPSKSPDSAVNDLLDSSMSSQCSLRDAFERDSGSFTDDVYVVPPKPDSEEIYDFPPKPDSGEIYDILPLKNGDFYNAPEMDQHSSDQSAPPAIDRSRKPPSVNREVKPNSSNAPPTVNRNLKPVMDLTPSNIHSYVNLGHKRDIMMSRGQSLPETYDHVRVSSIKKQESTDESYCDMQPCRSDSTRCYSFSKDQGRSVDESYELMEPTGEVQPKRESGVHSNSSSSEDGENESYMHMEGQDVVARGNRRAALQYCEVQIVEGNSQQRLQIPVSQRDSSSHYTTINEESTKAFLQTCSARKECLQDNS